MKIRMVISAGMFFLLVSALPAWAHFGMLIPSDTMVMQQDPRELKILLSFSHPFERIGMDLAKPKSFALIASGSKQDLLDSLTQTRVMGHTAWQATFTIKRPGLYVFFMEPQPYWESAEDCFIIHHTKTVITAFGDDTGWDEEIGLKSEIVPVARPFGLYAGNVFQGIVKMNGKPVPWSRVEVEYYNTGKTYTAPTEYMITQSIKTDGAGMFTYAVPVAGWWGFAALNRADYKIPRGGEEKDVELGAVIWVYFHEMK